MAIPIDVLREKLFSRGAYQITFSGFQLSFYFATRQRAATMTTISARTQHTFMRAAFIVSTRCAHCAWLLCTHPFLLIHDDRGRQTARIITYLFLPYALVIAAPW